jgi:tRNA modification GTPase
MIKGSGSDLIIACSTGENVNSAISVIRIDGFKSVSQFDSFFAHKLNSNKPAYLKLNSIVFEGENLDQIMVTHFASPKSYTGNNMLELHVHGNKINVRRIISLFCKLFGARLAEPGEFTLRALKNKKLTLSQVEGLDILLNANTSLAFNSGLSLLNGELKEAYTSLYELMTKLLASIELFIDFSEDVGHEQAIQNFNSILELFGKELSQLTQRLSSSGASLLDPSVVIYGKTNSGKSTLFNSLIGRERSIVSNIEGTTRDYVVEPLLIDGDTYRLTDTAGIRDTSDPIESQGIIYSKSLLEKSFFKILVVSSNDLDSYSPEDNLGFDLVCISHLDQFEPNLQKLKTYSRIVLLQIGDAGSIGPAKNTKSGPIEPQHKTAGSIGPTRSYNQSQVSEIKRLITDKYVSNTANIPILSHRQIEKLGEIEQEFSIFTDKYAQLSASEPSIVASELSRIRLKIEELLGIITPDVVLDQVFKNFCIGK